MRVLQLGQRQSKSVLEYVTQCMFNVVQMLYFVISIIQYFF